MINISIICSPVTYCCVTHPKIYWVRKQHITIDISHGSVVGLTQVGNSHLELFALLPPDDSWGWRHLEPYLGWMSTWILSSWLAPGLGWVEQLGPS